MVVFRPPVTSKDVRRLKSHGINPQMKSLSHAATLNIRSLRRRTVSLTARNLHKKGPWGKITVAGRIAPRITALSAPSPQYHVGRHKRISYVPRVHYLRHTRHRFSHKHYRCHHPPSQFLIEDQEKETCYWQKANRKSSTVVALLFFFLLQILE